MGQYEQYADDLMLCLVNHSFFYHRAVAIEKNARYVERVFNTDCSEIRVSKFYKLAKQCANYFTRKFPESYHNDGMTCACLMRDLCDEFSTMEF